MRILNDLIGLLLIDMEIKDSAPIDPGAENHGEPELTVMVRNEQPKS
jgi:hypothetical protein